MATEHIVKSYDKELNELRSLLARMGGMCEAMIAGSVDALTARDVESATRIIEQDKQLDALELELENSATSMIALRAPVADDLREMISALKVSSILERIGDYAKNIAKRTHALNETQRVDVPRGTQDMAERVSLMLKDVLDAYIARDAEKALDVWERDASVDARYNSLFREILTYMMEDPRVITPCTHLLFVAKNLERIGDHVTNVAEIVYYLSRGELLAQKRPKKDVTSFTTDPEQD